MRLLVVEDSARLRESLTDGLSASGYAVDASADGRDALSRALAIEYDAIILDIMIPAPDGLSVLRALRDKGRDTPVLILTARDRVEQRVEGLRRGADDYLVKPFDFDELLARLEALTRRARGRPANDIRIGECRLDLAARQFLVRECVAEFTPREYAILELLFLNAGRVLSRSYIEEHIYSADRQVWSNAVDSAVAGIRRKLAALGVHDLIATRRGRGYIVENPVPERSAAS